MNLTFYQKKEEGDSGAVSMDVDIGAGKLLIPDRYQMMTGTMRVCVYEREKGSVCICLCVCVREKRVCE